MLDRRDVVGKLVFVSCGTKLTPSTQNRNLESRMSFYLTVEATGFMLILLVSLETRATRSPLLTSFETFASSTTTSTSFRTTTEQQYRRQENLEHYHLVRTTSSEPIPVKQ